MAALPAPEQLDTFWNREQVNGQDPETGAIIMADGTFTWKKNVWNKVGLLVIMNKVGSTNGYIELMVNDVLVFKVGVVVHRLNPDVEPDSVMLQFAYNQVPVSYTTTTTNLNLMAMMKGMQLQVITPPPPPPPPPSPPPPRPPSPPPPGQLCSFEIDVDYYGGDIKMLGNVSSAPSCCNACRATPNCGAWTYIWTKDCYLKYAGQYVKIQTYNDQYVSGIVLSQANSLSGDGVGDGFLSSSSSSLLQGVCLPSQDLIAAAGRGRAAGTAKRGVAIEPSSPFQLSSSLSSLEEEAAVESMSINSDGMEKFVSSSSSTPLPTDNDNNNNKKDPCSEEQQLLQLLVAGTWWHDWKLVPHRQDLNSGNSIQTTASMLGIEYVPTVESNHINSALDLFQTIVHSLQTQLFPAPRHLMGFPAPNLQSGAATTPEEAAAVWPVIQAATDERVMKLLSGEEDGEEDGEQQQLLSPVRLGSPIVTTCGSDCIEGYASPFDWLDAFFYLCKECRVDFIAFSVKSCTIDGLQAQLLEMRRYGKPLWITDLACPPHATTTINGNRSVMTPLVLKGMLDLLDNDYYVERYAISSGYIHSGGGEEGIPVAIGLTSDRDGGSIDKVWRASGSSVLSSLEEEEEKSNNNKTDSSTIVVDKILPQPDNRQWTDMCRPCLFADLELQDEVVKLKCGNLCGLWVDEREEEGGSDIIPL